MTIASSGEPLEPRLVLAAAHPFELSDLLEENGGDGTLGFVVNGGAYGDHSGAAVQSAGDVNGDGLDDVVIGARIADPNGRMQAGEAYLVFGTVESTRDSVNVTDLNGTNGYVFNGINTYDNLGGAVSGAGDVNGDGFDDLLLGAFGGDPNGAGSGQSYLIFGGPANLAALDAITTSGGTANDGKINLADLDPTSGVVINGIAEGDRSGWAVSGAGDVNGDGFDDFMIGTSGADPNGPYSGQCYVVFGGMSNLRGLDRARTSFDDIDGHVELADLSPSTGFVFNGEIPVDYAGRAVSSAGDVNGDGFDDLLIGAFAADPNGRSLSGRTYLIFGGINNLRALDLASNGGGTSGDARINLADVTVATGFSLNGINPYSASGWSISGNGDVNGDGFDDLLIGTQFSSPNGTFSGQSYLLFGGRTNLTALDSATNHGGSPNDGQIQLEDLNGSTGFIFNGISTSNFAGKAVSVVGDVNGDGFDDLLIGAYKGFSSETGLQTGQSYVLFGGPSNLSALEAMTGSGGSAQDGQINLADLDGETGFAINGIDLYDFAGWAVSDAGDVNGDGFGDLLIGAYLAESSAISAGQSYVVLGGTTATGSTQIGTTDDDTLVGSGSAEVLIGGRGNDLLVGDEGANVLIGGAGDDIAAVTVMPFQQFRGGNGTDTLRFDGQDQTLNLLSFADHRLTDVEVIDLTGTGNNSLKLNQREVLNLSSTSNALSVIGDAGDAIQIGAGWLEGAGQTIDDVTYRVFTNEAATLRVATDVTVTTVNTLLHLDEFGNLLIESQGLFEDSLTIQSDVVNSQFIVSDPNRLLDVNQVSGATVSTDGHSVAVPFNAFSGGIQFITGYRNDSVTIDLSLGNFGRTVTMADPFNDGESDEFQLKGAVVESVTHSVTGDEVGSTQVSGNALFRFSANFVIDSLVATHRVFNGTTDTGTLQLTDAFGSNMRLVDQRSFVTTTFANPTASLTINAGEGNNTVTVTSVDSDGPFNASLTINGDAGNDTVQLRGDLTLAPGNHLNVDLTDDGDSNDVDAIEIGIPNSISAKINLSGTGAATLKASRSISLARDSSLITVDGDLTIEANQQAVPTTGNFSGIYVFFATVSVTGQGSLSMKGRAGNFRSDGAGLEIQGTSVVSGGSVGTTTLIGDSGENSDSSVVGTFIEGTVTSAGSNVEVIGLSPHAGGGVSINGSNSKVTAGGSGSVTVIGDASTSTRVGAFGVGFGAGRVSSSSGPVTVTGVGGESIFSRGVFVSVGRIESSGDGDVTVTGRSGTQANSTGIYLSSLGTISSTGGGDVALLTDSLVLETTGQLGTVSASSNAVTLNPVTTNTRIHVSETNTGNPLTVSGLQLNRITAAKLILGSVTFENDSNIDVEIDGASGTGLVNGHEELIVSGTVELRDATLNLSVNGPVAIGHSFVIIQNDDTDLVSGTFLVNGASVGDGESILVGGERFVLDYTSGPGGNDVSLIRRDVDPSTEVTFENGRLVIEDVAGGNSNDQLSISIDRSDAANPVIRITDVQETVSLPTPIAGSSASNDHRSVSIPLDLITDGIEVMAQGGDDSITINAVGDVTPFERNIFIYAGSGNDVVTLDASLLQRFVGEELSVFGEGGNDVLDASAISGSGRFAVLLDGGADDDTLRGGDKNDTLTGGSGDNEIDGGGGYDTLAEHGDVDFTLTATTLTGSGLSRFSNIETARVSGGSNNNTIDATNAPFGVLLFGGDGEDVLMGSAFDDVLTGGFGSDLLAGGDGDDRFLGGEGGDRLLIATQHNVVIGANTVVEKQGPTRLFVDVFDSIEGVLVDGGASANRIDARHFLGEGASIRGGGGNDTIFGSPGLDVIRTEDGNDYIASQAGNDVINAGAGNDTISGGRDHDMIDGGEGDDLVAGSVGNDLLFGGDGNDSVDGGNGDDGIYGNAGHDTLVGGLGRDVLSDDAGQTTIHDDVEGQVVVTASGYDSPQGGKADITGTAEIVKLTLIGSVGDDVLDASALSSQVVVRLDGSLGNDALRGSSGNDVLIGGAGNDTVLGGAGNDRIFGGVGNDLLLGEDGDDTMAGEAGTDRVTAAGNQSNLSLHDTILADRFVTIDNAFSFDFQTLLI